MRSRFLHLASALALGALVCGSAAAGTLERRVDAPYRFSSPTDRPASGLDEEKARLYRDDLRGQLRREETRQIDRTARGAERLRETRRELERMNNVLNEPRPVPPPRAQPEARIPGGVGGVFGDLGPETSSGGHPQPTPEEIREREAARQGRLKRNGDLGLNPVYDLYGQRIQ
jgi:hypothetical protein